MSQIVFPELLHSVLELPTTDAFYGILPCYSSLVVPSPCLDPEESLFEGATVSVATKLVNIC
jgi:hypothetical protein